MHLADAEVEWSDTAVGDNRNVTRPMKSDYMVIVRVFVVLAIPVLAAMVHHDTATKLGGEGEREEKKEE